MSALQVVFSRSLYTPEAVAAAVSTFAGLGTFEVQEQDDSIEVTVTEPDPDVEDVLLDELCNHALSNTIAQRNRFTQDAAGASADDAAQADAGAAQAEPETAEPETAETETIATAEQE